MAALTTEGAAAAFGLRFFALESLVAEVWLDLRSLGHPAVLALRELLRSPGFSDRVAHFLGYDVAGCGEQVSAR
jgi:hypothetical protein